MVRIKLIRQILLMVAFASLSLMANAVTIVDEVDSQSQLQNSTQFGQSGVITRYMASRSILQIDGIDYQLVENAGLNTSELKAGARVYFNIEQSGRDKLATITKVWLKNE